MQVLCTADVTPYLVPACAGCHVEHGPVLRAVDVVAPEHGIDLLTQTGLLRQVQQQLQEEWRVCCHHVSNVSCMHS